jgi:hypothetical protein
MPALTDDAKTRDLTPDPFDTLQLAPSLILLSSQDGSFLFISFLVIFSRSDSGPYVYWTSVA